MSVLRRTPSRRRTFVFATALAAVIGGSTQARAQVSDNLQSQLDVYKTSVFPTEISGVQQLGYDICISSGKLIRFLFFVAQDHKIDIYGVPDDKMSELKKDPQKLEDYFSKRENRKLATELIRRYFISNPQIAEHRWQDLQAFLRNYLRLPATIDAQTASQFAKLAVIQPTAVNFCAAATTVKVSFPFNPTYETNALKNNQNNSVDTSSGFGGSLQLVTPGLRPLDLIGLSAQSQSVRYSQFTSKNFDSFTTQLAYQFFIDAYALKIDGTHSPMNETTKKEDLAPANMITVDTVTIGIQNQTVYVPLFRIEQTNLFTPQVTIARQNIPLFGGGQCLLAIPDPSKNGYCYYTDISATVGETLSDVATQENANLTVAATPGWRIDNTDWVITLPASATARDYQNVPGGRRDLQLQIGPTFAYAPPPFVDPAFISSVLFKLSTTYNQQYSTVAKNSWHGIIVMPTLTVAFAP